jgi:hypothetical protein
VVRDMNGEVLAAGAGNIRHASSALHAEAIAAYKSILHAAQLGYVTSYLGNGCHGSGYNPQVNGCRSRQHWGFSVSYSRHDAIGVFFLFCLVV